MRRLHLWLSLGISALLIGYWGFSEPDLREALHPAAPSQEVDAYLRHAQIIEFDPQGRQTRRLTAEQVTHHPADDATRLTQPQLEIQRPGQPPLLARAQKGTLTSGGERVILEEAVEIRSDTPDNPYRLETESLTLDPNLKTAETRLPVTLHSNQGVTRATGMKAYIEEGRLELLSKVRGTYAPH